MDQNTQKITSIKALQSYAEGAVISLPPFGPDQPFVARIRRPSLLKMAKNGDIPNSLLSTAEAMFAGDISAKNVIDGDNLKNLVEVCECMAKACFLEPSWEEIEKAGVELTDDQFIFIFNYAQRGVQELTPFRQEQAD